jgi:GH25 family lysozyme M1 (1,4-beta-N-acetylmuramidase)
MKKCLSFLASLALLVVVLNPTYAMESKSVSNVKGIDVSHWDGTIDWSQVEANGVKFAYLKASEGTTFVDNKFAENVIGAEANAIAVGAYHYAKPTLPYKPSDAQKQAVFFAHTMQSNLANYGDLMPALDLEENGGLSPNQLGQWVRVFANTVELLTHRQVMIYVSEDFLQKNGNLNNRASDLPLWVSYWNHHYAGKNPPDTTGWNQWTAWQYSSKGTVPGIIGNVDLDVSSTSLDALRGNFGTGATLDLPTMTPSQGE